MKRKFYFSYMPLASVAMLSVSFFIPAGGVADAADGGPDISLVTHETSIGNAEILAIPSSLKISPDGKHMAFIAVRGDNWLLVTDGVLGKEYEGIGESSLVFSPEGNRIAYAAMKDNNWLLVVDGAEGAANDGLRDVVFSPDGRRVAYAANRGNNWSVVVDGVEGKKYDDCGEIVFSPDNRRVAYGANRGRNWSVIVDGTGGKEHDFICGITFSPDSRRVAYEAKHGNNWSVVVDGNEGKEYDAVGRSGRKNPEGARKAYTALRIDPQGVEPGDIVGESGPVFSPDSTRIACWVRRGNKWLVIVDGFESKEYDGFIRGSNLVFDSPESLHAIAVLGKEALRVNIEIVEQK